MPARSLNVLGCYLGGLQLPGHPTTRRVQERHRCCGVAHIHAPTKLPLPPHNRWPLARSQIVRVYVLGVTQYFKDSCISAGNGDGEHSRLAALAYATVYASIFGATGRSRSELGLDPQVN